MSYVECPTCGLVAFSVAGWSSIDHCAGCDTALPQGCRTVTSIASHPRFRWLGPRAAQPVIDDFGRPAA
jgi:hypothetical protein